MGISYAMGSKLASITVKEFFESRIPPKIVSLCGSQRDGSYNKMLRDYAIGVMRQYGAEVEPIDLEGLNLPVYSPNMEATAFPANAQAFKDKLSAADGIFIASPEYNGFTTPLLYNSITWATRGENDMYAGFKGKLVSVMATSPGPMGGLRMIRSMDTLFQDMGSIVIPGANAIGMASKVFDENGNIRDKKTKNKIEATCRQLVQLCRYESNREKDCEIAEKVLHLMGEYGEVDVPHGSKLE